MKHWPVLLIWCLPMLAMAAEPSSLGRLFLTPAERAALDVVRQNSRPPEKIVTPNNAAEDEESITDVVAPPVVSVQGYVKRNDGKGTVWINGQPVQEKSASKDFEVGRLQGNTNQVPIKLPSTGQTIKLKAGQSYDPTSGKLVDNLRETPASTSPSTKQPDTDLQKKSKAAEKASESSPPAASTPVTTR